MGTPRAADGAGQAAVKLLVNGRAVEASPAPFVTAGRTLVPVRALFEALGAVVEWDEGTRAVTAVRGERWIRLRVGRRLACLAPGCLEAALLDVPAEVREGRTFVPARFVAEALGARVRWGGASRTVYVETGPGADEAPAAEPVRIASPRPYQVIAGPVDLALETAVPPGGGSAPAAGAGVPAAGAGVPAAGAQGAAVAAREVRFLLLDPETGRGAVVARGPAGAGSYPWLPDPAHDGLRLLAAVLYDGEGRFLGGDVIPVRVAVQPVVSLTGLEPGQEVRAQVSLGVRAGFVATHVRYVLEDPETGSARVLGDGDPEGPFPWTPRYEDNGFRVVRAAVYDRLGRAHEAWPASVRVAVPRRLALTGLASGAAVTRPVTLGVSANFAVAAVRYVLRDPATGAEVELGRRTGNAGFRWLPSPDQAGSRELLAVVTDAQGQEHTTPPVAVELPGKPLLFLDTVGPNQVLAGEVELRVLANVPLAAVEFQLVEPRSRAVRTIAGGADAAATYTWKPPDGSAGSWRLRAMGATPDGGRVVGEELPVRVHGGKLYGPRAVVEKARFLDLVTGLAREARRRTGMSAALQVAQAILESGWGQYVPVDRYTGAVSYNLFGIKGQGPAGSVTSTTSEYYNGVYYRVDAAFRAYRDVGESWRDHKALLLGAKRYEPLRAVMHDPVRGAWALKRTGYATSPAYALSLIRIVEEQGLHRLDEEEV